MFVKNKGKIKIATSNYDLLFIILPKHILNLETLSVSPITKRRYEISFYFNKPC